MSSSSYRPGNRGVVIQGQRSPRSGSVASRWSADSGYGSSNGSSLSSASQGHHSSRYRSTPSNNEYYTSVRELQTSRNGPGIVLIQHHSLRSDCYDDRSDSGYGSRRSSGLSSHKEKTKEDKKIDAATEPLSRTPGSKQGPSDAPNSALAHADEPIQDSGAEDESQSSDGEEEEDEESEQETTPESRPNGERTSSGSSSDASLVSPLLDIRRRHMIDRLMIEFRGLLNQTIGARSRPSAEVSRSGSSSEGHGLQQDNSGQGFRGNNHDGSGQEQGPSPPGNGQSGGDGNSNQNSRSPSAPDLSRGCKFACPYFKRDPRKHGKHRSCIGPGWSTVHRVKEHIYRQHQLPAFCTRCGTTFAQGADLVAHTRLALACDVRVFDPPDGFSKEQERALRRKRKFAGSEDSKWRAMYRILFPDDDEADMPSPYHEQGTNTTWETRRSQEFDNYERYLRRELPRLVRQQLEIAASEVSGPLENHLRGQLIEIVRDAQSQLFQRYRGSEPASACPATSPSQAPFPELQLDSAMTGLEFQNNTINSISNAQFLEFDFSAYFQQPPIDENYVNPVNILPVQTSAALGGEHQPRSDSGYGSMGIPAELDSAVLSHNRSTRVTSTANVLSQEELRWEISDEDEDDAGLP